MRFDACTGKLTNATKINLFVRSIRLSQPFKGKQDIIGYLYVKQQFTLIISCLIIISPGTEETVGVLSKPACG